jgi:hypothetical protein
MAEKVFIERKSYKLISDERDVILPMGSTKQVEEWCLNNNITAERVPQIFVQTQLGVTLWRIKDEQQRMWFMLRWS